MLLFLYIDFFDQILCVLCKAVVDCKCYASPFESNILILDQNIDWSEKIKMMITD